MPNLHPDLVAAGISVSGNNQQIISALNHLYDNSPTFRFGVTHLSRPVDISFGAAVANGQENYGISSGGQIQIHSSFSSNWVPGSTAANLGGPGAPVRWEVDATTSTWVQVAPSFIEVLAHEILHNTTYAGSVVAPQTTLWGTITGWFDGPNPIQIAGGHFRFDADTVTAGVNQISYELWSINQTGHFTFKPFNGADHFALRQDPLLQNLPHVLAGDPFRWNDPLLTQLQLRSDISWMNLPQVAQGPYDPEGYYELMLARLTGANVIVIGFEPSPNAPGFDEFPGPVEHNTIVDGAFAWLRDDVLLVVVNGAAMIIEGAVDTLESFLLRVRDGLADDLGEAFREISFGQMARYLALICRG